LHSICFPDYTGKIETDFGENLNMEPTSNEQSPTTGGAAPQAGAGGAGGNQALQSSFAEAQREAQETLDISIKGQAQLNALRARPQ
jgi:hypothetical protein